MVLVFLSSDHMFILNQYQSAPIHSQSNEEYLITQVWQLKHIFFNEISAIKNINLEYLAFSKPFAEAFKFDETLLDRPISALTMVDQEIIQQERQILIDKVLHDSIYQFKPEPNIEMYLMRKRPLINPETGDCVGILILAAKLDMAKQRRIVLRYLLGKQINADSVIAPAEFTEQQQQILSCMLLGFQQRKDIARILEAMTGKQCDEVRIKNQLQALYQKHNCGSLNELMNLVVSNYRNIGHLLGGNFNEEIYNLE